MPPQFLIFVRNKKRLLFSIAILLAILLIFIAAYFITTSSTQSIKGNNSETISLTTRSYSLAQSRYYTTDLELDPKNIALIIIHPWNIGSPNGPVYPEEFSLFMGSKKNTKRVNKIMRERLAPLVEWARKKNIKVVYVMPDDVVKKLYSQFRLPLPYLEIPTSPETNVPFYDLPGVSPDNYENIRQNTTYGAGYDSWIGWQDLAISSYISPRNSDIVVSDLEGARLDKWLRDNDINTLLYAGFATDLCAMFGPIGLRDMFRRQYRLILLRDCTMAIEYPGIFKSRAVTDTTIRHVETYLGSSAIISVSD